MQWVLIDPVISRAGSPGHVLSFAAQRMNGWRPEGAMFHQLVKPGVDTDDPDASIDAATREALERDGWPAKAVYEAFSEYAQGLPLVSYDLTFHLDRVLTPEWIRQGLGMIGSRGFCAGELTRRLLDPLPASDIRLETLRQFYGLNDQPSDEQTRNLHILIDLFATVLEPLATQRGLATWEDIATFASSTWFPTRIAFGRFKGRHFTEARDDQALYQWLEWLASASNERSAEMGRWYLERLDQADDRVLHDSSLRVYYDPEVESLRTLIGNARTRLAELETQYSLEHNGVKRVQAELFESLRDEYQQRDQLRLVIEYRRRYLESLIYEGEAVADTVAEAFGVEDEQCERDYQRTAADMAEWPDLGEEDKAELQRLYKQLVRLFHPDRYNNDPDKQIVYERLTSEINRARDAGDLASLRDISSDPNGYLDRQGLDPLEFNDGDDPGRLRQLYEGLQLEILNLLQNLEDLRDGQAYDLYRMSRERPQSLQAFADRQRYGLRAEISQLQEQADRLSAELEALTGYPVF